MFNCRSIHINKITGDLLNNEVQQLKESGGAGAPEPPKPPPIASGKTEPKAEKPAEQRAPRPEKKGKERQLSPFAIMLNEAIKNSTDPEVAKIKAEIDSIRKERITIIIRIKESRRRLGYKEAEAAAITRLLDIERAKPESAEKRKKIGYLKRMKNKLEFRISTEASSLNEEKDLVRKIEEVNKELNEAYKTIRLERKNDLVKSDIEQFKKVLTEGEAKIQEQDKKLDELYDKLRKLLGIERNKHEKPQQHHGERKKQHHEHVPQAMDEINLEDIAVIKKKPKKAAEEDESA